MVGVKINCCRMLLRSSAMAVSAPPSDKKQLKTNYPRLLPPRQQYTAIGGGSAA